MTDLETAASATVALILVLAWFVYFIVTQCTKVQREQMISMMIMIFMALLFFTLYEQTYGSWVVFTDRLMVKNFFPGFLKIILSLVFH